MNSKKVSIIIPVKAINDYIHEALLHYEQLDYPSYEIFIFPDELDADFVVPSNVHVIASGSVGPAEKRDLALLYADGDYLAFIDDDAWPRPDWLKNAVELLDQDDVGAVGGPAVTAPNDSFLQQASGKVYESFLCSGNYTYRYLPKKRRYVDDLPSVNLIVKREVFEQIKGFDSSFYPGEDTKLCLDIVREGFRIIYDPDILVYHHRRYLFRGHLKQITNYAKHRGYFVKTLPQTSLRLSYFLPTLFVLGLVAGPVVCAVFPVLWYAYFGVLGLYVVLAAVSLFSCRNICLFFFSFLGIVASHIGYGIYFVKGLLSKKLMR